MQSRLSITATPQTIDKVIDLLAANPIEGLSFALEAVTIRATAAPKVYYRVKASDHAAALKQLSAAPIQATIFSELAGQVDGLSMPELCARTSLSKQAITSGLQALRDAELVASVKV